MQSGAAKLVVESQQTEQGSSVKSEDDSRPANRGPLDDQVLYPPRCRPSRRMWGEMATFKKMQGKKRAIGTVFEVPPSEYMRACAQQYAERLGLVHTTVHEGDRVRMSITHPPPRSHKRSGSVDGSSVDDGSQHGTKHPKLSRASASAQDDGAAAAAAKAVAAEEKAALSCQLRQCSRKQDAEGALKVYAQMREGSHQLLSADCAMLIRLCADAEPAFHEHAKAIFEAAFRERSGALDEACFTTMVRLLSQRGELSAARETLERMAASRVEPKLRTFSPYVGAAVAANDAASAACAVQRITAAGLAPAASEFFALARLHACRANTDGVVKLLRWFALEEISLPKAMVGDVEDVFRLLSGAVGSLPSASRPALPVVSDAVSGAPTFAAATAAAAEAVVESLKAVATVQPPATAQPQTTAQPEQAAQSASCTSPSAAVSKDAAGDGRAPHDEPRRPCAWAVAKTTVSKSGRSENGLQLRPRELRSHDFESLKESLSELFLLKGPNEEFERYKLFVAREGPFDLVIDGANVGFFGQGGVMHRASKKAYEIARGMPLQADGRKAREQHFRLDLIDAAVEVARKASPRVLLVLHVSHSQVPRGSAAEATFQRWKDLNLLYLTPRRQPDDFYWLYAAFASGKRCAVISNDEMRDHTSSLFAGRMFGHWKDRHQVLFTLGPHSHKLLPQLHFPPPFTKCVQEDVRTGSWHFPVEGEKYWLSAQPMFPDDDAP